MLLVTVNVSQAFGPTKQISMHCMMLTVFRLRDKTHTVDFKGKGHLFILPHPLRWSHCLALHRTSFLRLYDTWLSQASQPLQESDLLYLQDMHWQPQQAHSLCVWNPPQDFVIYTFTKGFFFFCVQKPYKCLIWTICLKIQKCTLSVPVSVICIVHVSVNVSFSAFYYFCLSKCKWNNEVYIY